MATSFCLLDRVMSGEVRLGLTTIYIEGIFFKTGQRRAIEVLHMTSG